MKVTTFYIVIGLLSVVSLTCGFLGWFLDRKKGRGKQLVDGSSFEDVLEDNEPTEYVPPDYCPDSTYEFEHWY